MSLQWVIYQHAWVPTERSRSRATFSARRPSPGWRRELSGSGSSSVLRSLDADVDGGHRPSVKAPELFGGTGWLAPGIWCGMEQRTIDSARASYRHAMAQAEDPAVKREFRRSVGLLDAIESNRGVTVVSDRRRRAADD
jgi:hypothetical protein